MPMIHGHVMIRDQHTGKIADLCTICGGNATDGSLTTDCPRTKLSSDELFSVARHEINFIGNSWRRQRADLDG